MDKKGARKVYYSLIPTTSSIPGGGTALVTATTANFYLGDKRNTYLSNVTFSPSTSFTGRYVFPFRSSVWLKGNTWNFLGDMRYFIYPQYTWGLGGNHPENARLVADYQYFRFYHSALKRVKNFPFLFAGLGYDLDVHFAIHTDNDTLGLKKFTGYNYGTDNDGSSVSSGPVFNVLYDSRDNTVNATRGLYANMIVRVNTKMMGSDDSWQSLFLDVRKYISLTESVQKKNILAFWSYYWTSLGNNTPYLDLPAIGWDASGRSGRGIEQNRYRGKGLFYLESEYRHDLSYNGLWGYVLFANIDAVTEQNSNHFVYWHPAGGAGLRIKFNKRSNTNVAIDFGCSKNYYFVYINLGETF
ncbi:hypothetical protein F5148DRAFT_1290907 [Russula earlei]|uniref:Uncharacterized protein n=1 Tax=Russula earlei TaxID=71964 RepID=A0ACC0TW77_9AGAM|nr:hypothetical protein F5148DRAFT_1290907 [Russula earlei]